MKTAFAMMAMSLALASLMISGTLPVMADVINLGNVFPSTTQHNTVPPTNTSPAKNNTTKEQVAYFTPNRANRRVYVAEWKNYRPPAGAPLFYAPWPGSLCMLGFDVEGEGSVRVIYEKTPNACRNLAVNLISLTRSAPIYNHDQHPGFKEPYLKRR